MNLQCTHCRLVFLVVFAFFCASAVFAAATDQKAEPAKGAPTPQTAEAIPLAKAAVKQTLSKAEHSKGDSMKLLTYALIVFQIFVFSTSGFAIDDTLRCPSGELIFLGDNIQEVLGKCGNPVGRNTSQVIDDQFLYYNFGQGDYSYTFQFQDGKLLRIVNSGPGY